MRHRRRGGAHRRRRSRRSCRTARSTCSPTSTRAAPPRSSRRSTRAADAWHDWSRTPWEERAAVFLRAAELLAGPWRSTLERRDDARPVEDRAPGRDRRRLRADRLLALQRRVHDADLRGAAASRRRASGTGSSTGRSRASSSRSRRSTSPRSAATSRPRPALMGNTVVWKPASTAAYSAHFVMQLLQEAGLPDGVINLVYGDGRGDRRPRPREPGPRRDPLHRLDGASSTACGRRSATNIERYRSYPRIVGETGGKDFIVAHPSADVDALVDRDRPRRRSSTRGRSARPRRASTSPSRSVAEHARAARRPGRAS